MKNNDNSLRNEENIFNFFINNISDVLIDVSLDGTVNYVNSPIFDLLGYLKEDFLGMCMFDFVHPDDYSRFSEVIKKSRKEGTSLSIEYRLRHKNGHYVYVSGRGNFVSIEGKIKVIAILRDITERKKREDQLLLFQFMIESAQDAIFFKDLKSRYILANNKALEVFRKSYEEVEGKNDLELMVDEKEACKNIEDDQLVFTTGEIKKVVKHMTVANGKEYWFQTIKVPRYDNEKNVIGLVGIARDITNEVIAENLVLESEEKYRHLFEHSPYSIGLLNSNGNIIDSNHNLELLLGYTKEELIGKDFKSAFKMPPESLSIATESFKKCIKLIVPEPREIQFYTKSGKLIWVSLEASFIKVKSETLIQLIGQNITDRKEAEQQLIKSEEKYRTEFTRAEFYKDLLSHDTNNILHGILVGSQFCYTYLENQDYKDTIRKFLNLIQEDVKRGANLISSIRKLSEIEKEGISLEKIDLQTVLEDTISSIKKTYIDQKIEIQIDALTEKSFVQANEFLRDVFENILINAIIHNDNSLKEIGIKIFKEQKIGSQFIKFKFIDNGIGIDNNQKKTIFSRGLLKEKSTRGMGIGLYLVETIIKSYHGEIWVEDKVKGDHTKGSAFILLIPEAI